MLRKLLVLAVVTAAIDVHAADTRLLRRCESATGEVSIQDEPCPPGSKLVWSRQVRPDPVTAPRVLPSPAPAPSGPVYYPMPSGPSPAQQEAEQQRARCEQAKAWAKRERDRRWRDLSIQDRRNLDAYVAEQCKRR